MTRCMLRAMEWLAPFVLLGMALPTSGEVFESSLDRTTSKLSFQCTKVTATGCRKVNPDMEVVLNSLIGSFGSGISCALNRSVGTSFRDLEYFFNENCLTKPIKTVIFRLDESQIQEEATKSGCSGTTQRLSKLTVQYGCVSRSTAGITLTQTTSVRNDTALSSSAQSTTAIHSLSSRATTGSSKMSITSSLPSAETIPLSSSTAIAAVTTVQEKVALFASTNARPTAAWSTAVDKTITLPLTSSGASGTAEGTTVTVRLENSENASTGPSNQAITPSFPSASTMFLTSSSVKTNFATAHDKNVLSTSTNVRPSAAWSTPEGRTQMMPVSSPGASAITVITATRRLENSASIRTTQPTTVQSEAAASFPHHRTTALYTRPSIVTTASSKHAITLSLPSASTLSLSQSTVNTNVTTSLDKSALSIATSVRPSAALSTLEAKTLMLSRASSSASETAGGITVTWTSENSASTITNISDTMMNQSLSTEPVNRMDIPSKAVSNNEDWWNFFKTNEGITVSMVSLLVLCLTICGLALIFCSRSKKGIKRPGNPSPRGSFVTMATCTGHAMEVPNGKENAAELGIIEGSNLYVDEAAYDLPSEHPTKTNKVPEHQITLPLPSKSSFDGPSWQQSEANACNFADEPVAQSTPGSPHENDYCAVIGDATGMLRILEERRVSDHSPSVKSDPEQSAVKMTSESTKESGTMLSIEEDEAYRASCVPPTRQFENIQADATQQLPANPQADETPRASEYLPQTSWSTSAGAPRATPGNSFPVALNVDVRERSMDTAL